MCSQQGEPLIEEDSFHKLPLEMQLWVKQEELKLSLRATPGDRAHIIITQSLYLQPASCFPPPFTHNSFPALEPRGLRKPLINPRSNEKTLTMQ